MTTPEKIIAAVADEYNLYSGSLRGPIRSGSVRSPVRDARQALYLLLRKHTAIPLIELAEALGCGAAAIANGESIAKKRLVDDERFCRAVNHIERRLAEPEDMGMQDLSKAIRLLARIATKLEHAVKVLENLTKERKGKQ